MPQPRYRGPHAVADLTSEAFEGNRLRVSVLEPASEHLVLLYADWNARCRDLEITFCRLSHRYARVPFPLFHFKFD